MGGGMPMGGFISSKENMNLFTHNPMLGHITTFGGHPINCAAALANLEVIEQENLLASAEEKGALIESLLSHPKIVEVRRRGLMFAVEFESAELVAQIVNKCLESGLITFWFLSCPESFRLAPPLTITKQEIQEGCEIINQAVESTLK
jgi:4-aminobutyrate aminotransferase-like enzyme